MWDLILSGKGPTNNDVTLSIFRPTYHINIMIPESVPKTLEGVKETHNIGHIKQMIFDTGIVEVCIDMFELSFLENNLTNELTIGDLSIKKGNTLELKYC